MSTTERHRAAVAWAVESAAGAQSDPIDGRAVPGPSSERLDAARRRADQGLADARDHRDGLAASLADLRQERSEILSAISAAERASSAATERGRRIEIVAEAALERAAQLAPRLEKVAVELDQAAVRESAVTALRAGLEAQVELLSRGTTPSTDQQAAAVALEQLGAEASSLGLETAAGSLASWSKELDTGTAALQRSAAAILSDLGAAEAQWLQQGSGDVGSAPTVIEALAELDAARGMLSEVEAEARSGGLGHRARTNIDAAHRQRTAVEAKGKRAQPGELALAIEEETFALREVGFDSILDYRIALATHGPGTLVGAAKRNARERVAQLESSLEEVRRHAERTQMQIRDRIDQLHRAAEELTGDPGELPVEQALQRCLETPEPVRAAVAEVQSFQQRACEHAKRLREDLHTAQDELRAVEAAHAEALVEVLSSFGEAEKEQQTVHRSQDQLVELEQSIDELVPQLADAERATVEALTAVDVLAQRRYLDEDVRSFSEGLISVVEQYIGMLDEHHDASSIVVDDPLDGFDDGDALAVLDELISRDWSLPVLFVTSRPKLVNRMHRSGGQVRCIDGRKRLPGLSRWSRLTRANPRA